MCLLMFCGLGESFGNDVVRKISIWWDLVGIVSKPGGLVELVGLFDQMIFVV